MIVGWEAILRGFEQNLRDNLPGVLAAVAAQYADDILVPPPVAYLRYVDQTHSAFPAVYIVPGAKASGEEQTDGWVTTASEVLVAAEIEGPDPASVAAVVLRYEAAIRTVVLRTPYPDPCHYVGWVDTIPGDVFQFGSGAAFRSWVELKFVAKVFEEQA